MKISLLLLAALCGLCTGIQYPYSYRYDYSGEIKTGIHELRNQYAGSKMTAKVLITVVSSSQANVQITDPRVGSMNGDVPSEGRAPLPISRMEDLKDKLAVEQSFVVNFSGRQEKLRVPRGEMLWISNMRKAIVSLFRVPYVLSSPVERSGDIRQNRLHSDTQYPRTFTKQEQTIHGECSVLYTFTPASPSNPMHLKALEQDAQKPTNDDRAYRLVRSVDFDSCSERVVLRHSSHGNLTEAGNGQLRGVQSRTVVGEFLLSGTPTTEQSMRIESAIIEGVTTFNPMAHETKKITTFTNQTLTLVSVTNTSVVPNPTSPMQEETWNFRVLSPYQRGQDSPSWVSFQGNNDPSYPSYPEKDFTGFQLTVELREQIKSEIKNTIDSVSRQIRMSNKMERTAFGGSSDGASLQKMQYAATKMRALPTEDIEKLFGEIAGQSPPPSNASPQQIINRQLMINAMRTSGSPAAIKVLMQKIRSKQMSELEAANVFITLPASITSPTSVKDLVDYVTEIQEDASVSLKSSALVCMSTVIRRLCINKAVQRYSTRVEMMGRNQCDHAAVHSKYIPYLKNRLQSAQKNYLKAIYVQALANVGDISSVEIISQVALGKLYPENTPLRILAIQGLSKNHMVNSTYYLARETLLTVAEQQVEKPILREAAVSALFSLPNNATIFQRMALSTWREPSRRVASFIYTTIKSFAQSKNPHFIHKISVAKHVLPLAKPQPRSPYYSGKLLDSHYETAEDMAGIIDGQYLSSDSSLIPEAFTARLKTVFGGFKTPLVHASGFGKGIEKAYNIIMDNLRGLIPSSASGSSVHVRNHRQSVEQFDSSTRDHLDYSPSNEEDDEVLLAHLTLLKHIDMFSPITKESLKQLNQPSKSFLASAVHSLKKGDKVIGLSFFTSAETTLVLPSEIGLPVIHKMSHPVMLYTELTGEVKMVPEYQDPTSILNARLINLTCDAVTKVISKRESSVLVLVPWNNKTLVTGVDGEVSFSLSASFSAVFDRRQQQLSMVQLSVRPNFSGKSPIVVDRNLPFTMVRELFASSDVTQQSLKPINVIGDKPSFESRLQVSEEYTGLDAAIEYSGDTAFPINRTTVWERIQRPVKLVTLVNSPTTRRYQLALMYNPDQSSTKQITATFSSIWVPQPLSLKDKYVPVVQDLSAADSITQRVQKLKQATATSMWSGSLKMNGSSETIQYEGGVVFFAAVPQSFQAGHVARNETRFQVNLMRAGGKFSQAQICASSVFEYPILSSDISVPEALSQDLQSRLATHVYAGQSCSQNNMYYKMQGNQSISEERKQQLQKPDIAAEQFPPMDSTQAVKTAPVYDRINLDIKQMKAPSDMFRNMTNHASDIAHGLLFPNMIHNSVNVHGQQGLQVIQGYRSLATDRYTFWIHSNESICLLQDLKVPAIFDYVSPLNVYWQPAYSISNIKVRYT